MNRLPSRWSAGQRRGGPGSRRGARAPRRSITASRRDVGAPLRRGPFRSLAVRSGPLTISRRAPSVRSNLRKRPGQLGGQERVLRAGGRRILVDGEGGTRAPFGEASVGVLREERSEGGARVGERRASDEERAGEATDRHHRQRTPGHEAPCAVAPAPRPPRRPASAPSTTGGRFGSPRCRHRGRPRPGRHQRVEEGGDVGMPVVGILGERAGEHVVRFRRLVLAQAFTQDPGRGVLVGSGRRCPSRQDLGRGIGRKLASVATPPDRDFQHLRVQADVGDAGPVLGVHQDVGGAQRPMGPPALMKEHQARADLPRQPEALLACAAAVGMQHRAQRPADLATGDAPEQIGFDSVVQDRDDVGMDQIPRPLQVLRYPAERRVVQTVPIEQGDQDVSRAAGVRRPGRRIRSRRRIRGYGGGSCSGPSVFRGRVRPGPRDHRRMMEPFDFPSPGVAMIPCHEGLTGDKFHATGIVREGGEGGVLLVWRAPRCVGAAPHAVAPTQRCGCGDALSRSGAHPFPGHACPGAGTAWYGPPRPREPLRTCSRPRAGVPR